MHTCAALNFSYSNSIVNFLLQCFISSGYLAVGIFFFISGYGLMHSKIEKPYYLNGFLNKRLPAVLIPLIITNIIYLIGNTFMGVRYSIFDILYSFININVAMRNSWYIITITLFYFIFYVIYTKYDDAISTVYMYIFVLAYMLILYLLKIGCWWYVSCLPFLLGITVAKYYKTIFEFLKKYNRISLFISFIMFLLIYKSSILMYKMTNIFYVEFDYLEKIFSSLIFTIFFIILFMQMRFDNKVLRWIGNVSLELYLIHGVFINLAKYSNIKNDFYFSTLVIFFSLISAKILNKLNYEVILYYKNVTSFKRKKKV